MNFEDKDKDLNTEINNSNNTSSKSYIDSRYDHMLKTRQIHLDENMKKSQQKRIRRYNHEISEQETIFYNKRLEQLKTKRLELDEEMKEYEKKQRENRRNLFK